MNIRSLTRGDGVVIGAAVLLLVFSFMPFFSFDDPCGDLCSVSSWSPSVFPVPGTVHLAAVIAAGLFVGARALPAERRFGGLGLAQWGTALSVFCAWAAIWSVFSTMFPSITQAGHNANDGISLGWGAYVSLVLALALAAVALLSPRLPALQAPLVSAPRPQPAPYGAGPGAGYGYPGPQQGYPGAQGQPGSGYGYPGAPQPGQQQFPQAQQPGASGQFPGQPSYGGPAGAAEQGAPAQPQPAAAAPAPSQPAADFAPFWFAVPVQRPLYGEDGSPNPVGELTPGTWYLAIDQRGAALVAQTQEGRRGVLQDTTGIQRG